MSPRPLHRLEAALDRGRLDPRPRLVAYLTGGYPDRAAFRALLPRLAEVSAALEIGVPFSDPMADGVTIQQASARALAGGATLTRLLQDLRELQGEISVPVALMSYLNPLLAHGPERLADDAAEAGVCAFVVPDLPLEEQAMLAPALQSRGLGLVQLVTPLSTPARTRALAQASAGFVYAVTRTGTTGGATGLPADLSGYLARVREVARAPVVAGFGIRQPEHMAALAGHVDGAIVGSALIDRLEAGGDPVQLLRELASAGGAP